MLSLPGPEFVLRRELCDSVDERRLRIEDATELRPGRELDVLRCGGGRAAAAAPAAAAGAPGAAAAAAAALADFGLWDDRDDAEESARPASPSCWRSGGPPDMASACLTCCLKCGRHSSASHLWGDADGSGSMKRCDLHVAQCRRRQSVAGQRAMPVAGRGGAALHSLRPLLTAVYSRVVYYFVLCTVWDCAQYSIIRYSSTRTLRSVHC